jgi:hypothetical protein
MEIVRVIYQGYHRQSRHYAQCFILIQRQRFSIAEIYEIAKAEQYPICSDIHLDILIESECFKSGGEFWEAYQEACKDTYAMVCFVQKPPFGTYRASIPRFSEADFQNIFEELGGHKIIESITETPDFGLNGFVLELKDIRNEALNGKDRRDNIGYLFTNYSSNVINLDPDENYDDATLAYHSLIKNSIHNHLKKASSQIKAYRLNGPVKAGGMIFLNTGMFSLPHKLFKTMVADLLGRRTKTIEFALVFSQVTQGNGFDNYAIFYNEFVGNVPDELTILKEKVDELIESKMTSMIVNPGEGLTLVEQQPISFFSHGKIFYWNPGPVPAPRLN